MGAFGKVLLVVLWLILWAIAGITIAYPSMGLVVGALVVLGAMVLIVGLSME